MNNPAYFGLSPSASGETNRKALQAALDIGGYVRVNEPGDYALAGTLYIGSDTTLEFAPGARLVKTNEGENFCHVILNKGALTKTWDERIRIRNLDVVVNGMDNRNFMVFGLHGQLALFYARDVVIEDFRCLDLGAGQYAIHICTFEDVTVARAIIRGRKDGVHFGRGRRFTVRDCVFDTFDDAVALNAHDYDVGNPELGWIEQGLVENCYDTGTGGVGYFCRILAGAWTDWTPGMTVQKSDTVVSNGRLYRVKADADGKTFTSVTRPEHASGIVTLDGIAWAAVQDDVTYTAGVRDVTFRNIFLEKPRTSFSVHFDNDRYSRSYYPGAPAPLQRRILLDGVRTPSDADMPFVEVNTPIDSLTIANSSIGRRPVVFATNGAMDDYGDTRISVLNTEANNADAPFVDNQIPGKRVTLIVDGVPRTDM